MRLVMRLLSAILLLLACASAWAELPPVPDAPTVLPPLSVTHYRASGVSVTNGPVGEVLDAGVPLVTWFDPTGSNVVQHYEILDVYLDKIHPKIQPKYAYIVPQLESTSSLAVPFTTNTAAQLVWRMPIDKTNEFFRAGFRIEIDLGGTRTGL